ncbi:hypothetical protein F2Q70_00005808 [Brassica cretica]|uniref:Uncharacterized protein n=1 Tax=Brassica cretica TaxID=69181 RepID=A0A8S9J0C8_BRACR|nr:hypothetical protein F2Q70_00005808 [Brassica cretica]
MRSRSYARTVSTEVISPLGEDDPRRGHLAHGRGRPAPRSPHPWARTTRTEEKINVKFPKIIMKGDEKWKSPSRDESGPGKADNRDLQERLEEGFLGQEAPRSRNSSVSRSAQHHEIDLLTTKFLKLDNEKVFYPNATLISKPISNYYRSPDMGDSILFSIAFSTSAAKIATLKEKVKEYLVQNTQNWYPEFLLFVQAIENVNKLNLNLVVTHTMNFQNFGEKNLRRTDLVIALKRILEDLEIDYTLLPQNVHLTGHK